MEIVKKQRKVGKAKGITDEKVSRYIDGFYRPINSFLHELRIKSEKENIPIIQKETETLLLTLLKMNRPSQILEIGTAVGYSALCFAMSNPESRITTLELQEKLCKIAKANFIQAGAEKQIRILQGDALDTLELLSQEASDGTCPPYDFIFIDGAKSHYQEIWDKCMKLCKDGTLIVADNILYKAMVASDEYLDHRRNKTVIRRMRSFLNHITASPGVTTTILPVGDGIAISLIGD